jgi:phage/plasmid-like protein (TIGR03299 family)
MTKSVRNAQNRTEAFGESKMNQILNAENAPKAVEDKLASGELTALGDNRYRVNKGWDSGEVITINLEAMKTNALTAAEAIKGDHGLDVNADGTVNLYSRKPAWWGVGTMVPAGLTSVEAVLKAAGLDFTVTKRPTPFFTPDGDWVAVPDSFTTVRTDADGTETPFATVGKIYKTVQNAEAFGFLEKLFMDHEFIPETAAPLRGGRKIFISAKMPESMVVDPSGIADPVDMYLIVANSHDGSTPITAYSTPWRPECANTERFGLRDAQYKFTIRHTRNWADKYAQAAETLRLSKKYADLWVQEETSLVQASFTTDDLDALISDVWGEITPEASARAVTLDSARREDIMARWEIESAKVGLNAYAAERAVTGSVDHFTTLKPRDAVLQGKGNRLAALGAAILEDALTEKKDVTHKRLLVMTNR